MIYRWGGMFGPCSAPAVLPLQLTQLPYLHPPPPTEVLDSQFGCSLKQVHPGEELLGVRNDQ